MLGFRLSPVISGKKHNHSIAWKTPLLVGLIVGGLIVGWIAGHGWLSGQTITPTREQEIDPRPIITSLQKLGELHTVKVSMKDVLKETSDRQAEGWLRNLPGGNELTAWATHNEALVVAQGNVEAGIDLSQLSQKDVTPIRMPDGAPGLRVHLPPVQVYAPQVTLTVQNNQSGLIWSDVNLIPKAEAKASRLFLDAAEKDHIREHAKENAVETLQHLQQAMGNKNIEFTF